MESRNQQSQQQGGQQGAPNGDAARGGVSNQAGPAPLMPGNAAHSHLMGLLTNPQLAAAAVGTPMFQSAAMMSNPGAFLAMAQQQQPGVAQPQVAPMVMPLPGGVYGQPNMQVPPTGMPFMQGIAPFPAPSSSQQSEHDNGDRRGGIMSADERAQLNRDRNREHARSTRLRKKAYVQKLKDLVEGLHAERTEEVRQRRVAIQHLADLQGVRRSVIKTFLQFHSNYETDDRKWSTILEDDFWLKQPVTPYRSFQRSEIEKECRYSRGVAAVMNDAASVAVMVESIGSRSRRWMNMKREEFLVLEESQRGSKKMPRCIVRQDSRLHHAISSLSSSSGSSNHASSGEDSRKHIPSAKAPSLTQTVPTDPKDSQPQGPKISESSGSSSGSRPEPSVQFHNYHDSQALPDPRMDDSDESPLGESSPEESNNSSNDMEGGQKRISADSSSGDDSAQPPMKRRKSRSPDASSQTSRAKATGALPSNIAKRGGIPHNIKPVQPIGNGSARLSMAPAIALPPFAGIGKKGSSNNGDSSASVQAQRSLGAPNIIANDLDNASSDSDSKSPQIRAFYHVNEDDMILMEDILMCPFIFRSQDAVLCGALAECLMPGMLRASFSTRNKLTSVELIYDAMGFMQQLERASGSEGSFQIIPGSLEMALAPTNAEARVITLARPPFQIVNVNDVWTRVSGYSQMEVEGKEYRSLLEGDGTVTAATERPGKPHHKLEEVAKGRCACSTNIHYDKTGNDFVEFVCSYPLTNANNEITHLLHVSKELPSAHSSSTEPTV